MTCLVVLQVSGRAFSLQIREKSSSAADGNTVFQVDCAGKRQYLALMLRVAQFALITSLIMRKCLRRNEKSGGPLCLRIKLEISKLRLRALETEFLRRTYVDVVR